MIIGHLPVPDRFAAAFGCANRLSCRFVNVDIEYTLESLRPEPAPDLIRGHRGAAFSRRGLVQISLCEALASPAPLGWRHTGTVLTVWREYAVKIHPE